MTMTSEASAIAIRVLACPMIDGIHRESGAKTVGHFLLLLGREVWNRGECFSGKRPFGNSGWNWDVYGALVEAGIIEDDDDDGPGHVRSECDQAIDHALNFMEQVILNIPSVIQLAHSHHGDIGLMGEALNTIKEATS